MTCTSNSELTFKVALLQFLLDSEVHATIACQKSVLTVHAKMMQETLRRNQKNLSTWNILNHFGICSDSFKLLSNTCLSLEP